MYGIAVQAFRLAEHDAEDVFQECFSRVYENLDKLRDRFALRPWIGQLTRRLLHRPHPRQLTRAPGRRGDLALAEDTITTLDESLTVHEALAGRLHDSTASSAQDQTYKTIGGWRLIPSGTIADRISRCLAKLHEALEGKNPGPEPV